MKKKNKPQITFAITCFNADETIARAIRSAQNQTIKDIEILVIDDGSSDKSVINILELMRTDPRIRLIRHLTNKGTGASRTRLVQESTGEFLAFLDDDDEAMPNRIELQRKAILEAEKKFSNRLIACYCSREIIKPSQQNGSYQGAIGSKKSPPVGHMVARNIFTKYEEPGYGFGPVGAGTLMVRKDVLKKIGDFDAILRRSQDVEWAIRLALSGGVFIGCPEPLIKQYITCTPDKNPIRGLKYSISIINKHKSYLKSERIYFYSILKTTLNYFNKKKWKIAAKINVILMILANFKIARQTILRK